MKRVKLNKKQAKSLGLSSAQKVIGRAPTSLPRGKVYYETGTSAASKAWQRGEYR